MFSRSCFKAGDLVVNLTNELLTTVSGSRNKLFISPYNYSVWFETLAVVLHENRQLYGTH